MNIIDTIRSWFYSNEPCYHAVDAQEASQDTDKKPVNKCCQGEFECWSEPIEPVENIQQPKTKQPLKSLVRSTASKAVRDIGKNLRNVFRS